MAIVTEPLGRGFLAAPKAVPIRWQQRAAAGLKDFSPVGYSSPKTVVCFVWVFFWNFIEERTFLSEHKIETKQKSTPNITVRHHLVTAA